MEYYLLFSLICFCIYISCIYIDYLKNHKYNNFKSFHDYLIEKNTLLAFSIYLGKYFLIIIGLLLFLYFGGECLRYIFEQKNFLK